MPQETDVVCKWIKTASHPLLITDTPNVIQSLKDYGVSVPNADKCGILVPNLNPELSNYAGMRQKSETMGAMAVSMLSDSFNNHRKGFLEEPLEQLVKGEWRDGPSIRRQYPSRI